MRNHWLTYINFIVAAASIACGLTASTRAAAEGGNTIFNDLLQRGVPFGNGFRRLRPPTLPDGLNAAAQQQAIAPILQLKPGAKPTYAQFIDHNLRAPHVQVIDDLAPPFGGGNQPGHSIDLWFVVWGDLDKIMAPAFLKAQFQPDSKDRIDALKPEELPKEIQLQQIPGGKDYYAHGQFMIFSGNPLIRVAATSHAIQTLNQESGTLAALVDPRFNQNAKFPNEWRPVLRNANGQVLLDAKGQPQLGQPSLYTSAGGYIKITKLVQPAGALFVEYHLVYDEPAAWFGGNPSSLRDKLPIKTGDDVRAFRRKAKAASAEEKN
jgi:hypothetical protein